MISLSTCLSLLLILDQNSDRTDTVRANEACDALFSSGQYHADRIWHSSALFIDSLDHVPVGGNDLWPMLMPGRIPGLFIIPIDFQPGNEGFLFLVEGVNSLTYSNPLFVVDGIPGRDVTHISIGDIESIALLKDATTAIFGGRGTNGVLFINTRHGSMHKPKLDIQLNHGFSQPVMIPEMADAATWASMMNEIETYKTGIKNVYYSDEEIQKFIDGSDPLRYPNTNWFQAAYKKVSWMNSIFASFEGGKRRLNYFASAGTEYRDGIFRNSVYDTRMNHIRANVEGKSKWLSYGAGLYFQFQHDNAPVFSEKNVFSNIFFTTPAKRDFCMNIII